MVVFGCEPKFDPSDDWEAVDVVYGVLNPDALMQYIQIGKGFQNGEASAIDLAKVEDSIYHQDSAIVELIEFLGNGTEVSRASLKRQKFDDRKDGVFINPEHYLYTISSNEYKIKDETNYKIKVTNSVTLKSSFAEIKTLKEFTFGNAFPEVNINLIDKKDSIVDQQLFIKNANGEDVIYQLSLVLPYYTTDEDDLIISKDSIEIIISSSENADIGNETSFNLSGDKFVNAFLDGIALLPENSTSKRELVVPYLKGTCYGSEMAEYVLAEESFNALSQTKPFYSNILDEETKQAQVGLFTSQKMVNQVVVISNKTISHISGIEPRLGFPQ